MRGQLSACVNFVYSVQARSLTQQPQAYSSVFGVNEKHLFKKNYIVCLLSSAEKQNELELPCPVPKSRERKRRQKQQLQQQQQQQQSGMMTQISGVRKVSHTPSICASTNNRFGVKTDQEELLSKVSD